jgi:hypothetical protein
MLSTGIVTLIFVWMTRQSNTLVAIVVTIIIVAVTVTAVDTVLVYKTRIAISTIIVAIAEIRTAFGSIGTISVLPVSTGGTINQSIRRAAHGRIRGPGTRAVLAHIVDAFGLRRAGTRVNPISKGKKHIPDDSSQGEKHIQYRLETRHFPCRQIVETEDGDSTRLIMTEQVRNIKIYSTIFPFIPSFPLIRWVNRFTEYLWRSTIRPTGQGQPLHKWAEYRRQSLLLP